MDKAINGHCMPRSAGAMTTVGVRVVPPLISRRLSVCACVCGWNWKMQRLCGGRRCCIGIGRLTDCSRRLNRDRTRRFWYRSQPQQLMTTMITKTADRRADILESRPQPSHNEHVAHTAYALLWLYFFERRGERIIKIKPHLTKLSIKMKWHFMDYCV